MKRTLLVLFSAAAAAMGQDVVSARAGMINYIEGKVLADGKPVVMPDKEKMFSSFPEVKRGSTLATAEGRAEVLLSPGVVMRLGEDTDLKMVDSSLINTKVELIKGVAIIEVAELLKENSVTIGIGEATVMPRRTGTYKLHAGGEDAQVMVYDGQAEVRLAGGEVKVAKRGNLLPLTGASLVARKFDPEKGDALTRWSMRRSGYVAMANISAASYANKTGWSYNTGAWRWNPFFGMYTYLPYRGMACSAFTGLCFYSPRQVYRAFYTPAPSYGGGFNSASGGGDRPNYSYNHDMGAIMSSQRTYDGYSNVGSVSGAPSNAAAVSAPAAPSGDAGGMRGGDGATGRGGGGRSQ